MSPTILKFVRKTAICDSSHILGIGQQSSDFNFFQKWDSES